MADSEGVAFLRSEVERFCREITGLAPAVRLRRRRILEGGRQDPAD